MSRTADGNGVRLGATISALTFPCHPKHSHIVVQTSSPAQPGPASDPTSFGGGFTSTRFVLVEPSHPGNVGAAARALKTMGFSRLVLVSPRVADVKNDPEAIAMASGADDVLASAHIVSSLADALMGAQWSLALTARSRE